MSLSAQEQQALQSIEDSLMGSDPKLASLLATFTRLTSGEEMPLREKIRAQWTRPARRRYNNRGCLRPNRAGQPASRLGRCLRWGRVMLVVGLTAVIAVAAITLIINSAGRPSPCTRSWALTCVQQAPAHSARPSAPGSG